MWLYNSLIAESCGCTRNTMGFFPRLLSSFLSPSPHHTHMNYHWPGFFFLVMIIYLTNNSHKWWENAQQIKEQSCYRCIAYAIYYYYNYYVAMVTSKLIIMYSKVVHNLSAHFFTVSSSRWSEPHWQFACKSTPRLGNIDEHQGLTSWPY